MTSISASASSSNTYLTPLQKLQQELQAELTSGKVTSGDSDALSSALAEIDKSLQSDASGQSGSTQSKPTDIKSKIDDLIDAQVASGKLTADQATELQGVFKAAFAGGPGGAGGPPGPPPSDSASTDATSSTDSTTDTDTALQKLLAALQESLAASSASSYSATGSSASSTSKSSFSALLVNYTS